MTRQVSAMICDEGVMMPRRAREGDAAYDIYAPHRLVLNNRWQTVDLGFRFEEGDIPPGWAALVITRSSTGAKDGLHIRNVPGLIDSGYRQNIKATLSMDGQEKVYEKDDRILQFIIIPVGVIPNEIPPEGTRTGGYGSTGV